MGLLVRDKWTLNTLYGTSPEQASTTKRDEVLDQSGAAPGAGSVGARGARQSLPRAFQSERPTGSKNRLHLTELADAPAPVTARPAASGLRTGTGVGGFPTLSTLRKYVSSFSRVRFTQYHSILQGLLLLSSIKHSGRGVSKECCHSVQSICANAVLS